MANDMALLDAARKGDPGALEQIFDLYAPLLSRYAMQLCHDHLQADLIVGDTFAKLLEQLSRGNGPRTNLRSYLYQITYHLLIQQARTNDRERPIDEAISLPDGMEPVSLQVEAREVVMVIRHIVQYGLTDEQRHVLLLRFVQGLNLRETARITGRSVNWVSVIQNRAIERIRKGLRRKFGAGPTPGRTRDWPSYAV